MSDGLKASCSSSPTYCRLRSERTAISARAQRKGMCRRGVTSPSPLPLDFIAFFVNFHELLFFNLLFFYPKLICKPPPPPPDHLSLPSKSRKHPCFRRRVRRKRSEDGRVEGRGRGTLGSMLCQSGPWCWRDGDKRGTEVFVEYIVGSTAA